MVRSECIERGGSVGFHGGLDGGYGGKEEMKIHPDFLVRTTRKEGSFYVLRWGGPW